MDFAQHPSADEAEEAARQAASSDRLMPGEAEAIESGREDDARHWLTVYEELFGFKQNLLSALVEQRDRIHADGMAEVENDEILLTREADRLSRRLEFWRRELAQRRSG